MEPAIAERQRPVRMDLRISELYFGCALHEIALYVWCRERDSNTITVRLF